MSDLEAKVRTILAGLDLRHPQIEVHALDHSVIATILSESFSRMDEGERQRMVWGALLAGLDDRESAAVEFVFTVAPGEQDAVDEAV